MYSLEGLNTAHEIKQYVIKAMQKSKCGITEIREYQKANNRYSELHQIVVSFIPFLNDNTSTNKLSND